MPSPLARAEDRLLAPSRPCWPPCLPPAAARLVGLRPGDCRWPIGDLAAESFGFCAAARLPGSSYCAPHRSLSCRAGS